MIFDAHFSMWEGAHFFAGFYHQAVILCHGGQGSFSFVFSDTNLVNFAETFFSIRDKIMMWMTLLTLAAFFMPRFSAITA